MTERKRSFNKMQKTRLYILKSGKPFASFGFAHGVTFRTAERTYVIGKNAFTSKAKAESELIRQANMREALKPRKIVRMPAKEYYKIAESIFSACIVRCALNRKRFLVPKDKPFRNASDVASHKLLTHYSRRKLR